MRLDSLHLDAKVNKAPLDEPNGQLGRLDRKCHIWSPSLAHNFTGSVANNLFIGDEMEVDITPRREAISERNGGGPEGRRDSAFHVGRSAAVYAAVMQDSTKRILSPCRRVTYGHDVQVPIESDRTTFARSRVPGDNDGMRIEGRRRPHVPGFYG